MSKKTKLFDTKVYPKTVMIGIWAPYNQTRSIDAYYEEFLKLGESCYVVEPITHFIKIRSIDSGYFLTEGKRIEVKKLCDEHEIEHVIFSEPLTPQQRRNLGKFFRADIFDRTDLILEIFEHSAQTAEGKLQVSIAKLEHKKTMLSGKGIGLAQQKGVIGVRAGFGETLKEKETRIIEDRIRVLKKQLIALTKTRETQRKRRVLSAIPLICLVGYTNAGKSSILNALTKSETLVEDKLFATLDTTTREFFCEGEKRALISDTVGFVQLLPPQLIEAFKSTLDELHYANLLLHVVDISDPDFALHIKVVHDVLTELGVVEKPLVYVFNKADLVNARDLKIQDMIDRYQPHVVISTLQKEDIQPLVDYVREFCLLSYKEKNRY
jgi:GTPase